MKLLMQGIKMILSQEKKVPNKLGTVYTYKSCKNWIWCIEYRYLYLIMMIMIYKQLTCVMSACRFDANQTLNG